ncbi:MAG: acetyl-CoA carboxylase biotin carboxyl carrier protein subunit [Bacteroidales bacterium]|nr:acetyl-CoA carboxylase biotin carboxyl carrier protein subunit [Bacteroidales bacterium]
MEKIKELEQDVKKTCYKSLLIENIKYRTLLTKKYLDKKPYERNDLKKITALIPGVVEKIYVKKGKKVKEGDKLLILEAMKMRNDIVSPVNGTIKKINVKEGSRVTKKDIMIELI